MSEIKLVILDRDGTLNKRIPDNYLLKIDDIERPKDFHELAKLYNSGIKFGVASNQACVSKKLISRPSVISITKLVLKPILEIDDNSIFICTHQDFENCTCRKPKPGLILKCLEFFDTNASDAIFIGDTERDSEAAASAGVKFIGVCWNSECLGKQCLHSITNAVKAILSFR
jgi:D-glycero-D-manno-heptose 1,7-bisphosphate phosphatase